MGVKSTLKPLGEVINKNLPTIFSACSGLAFTGATFTSFKAGTKAADILKDLPETETRKEKLIVEAKALAPVVWLPVSLWLTGSVFLYLSNKEYLKRLAVIGLAYTVAEKKSDDILDKVKETFGEKKADKVQSDISQDSVTDDVPDDNQIILTGHGTYLCKDGWSGRYFKSDIDSVKAAVNDLNSEFLREGSASLNNFYAYLGLQPIQYGDDIGWNRDSDDLITINYDSCLTPDGTPCIVLRYDIMPRYDFEDYC